MATDYDPDNYDDMMKVARSHLWGADYALQDWGGAMKALSIALDPTTLASEVTYILEDFITAAHEAQLARAYADMWSGLEAKRLNQIADIKVQALHEAIETIVLRRYLRSL